MGELIILPETTTLVAPLSEVSQLEPICNVAVEVYPITSVISSSKGSSSPSVGSQSSQKLLCDKNKSNVPRIISSQEKGLAIVGQGFGSAPNIVTILPLEGLDTNPSSKPQELLDAASLNESDIPHIPSSDEKHDSLSIQDPTPAALFDHSGLEHVQEVGSDDDPFNPTCVSSDDNQVHVEYENQSSTPPPSSSPLVQSSQVEIMSSPIPSVGFEASMDESHFMRCQTPETILTCQDENCIENVSDTLQVGKRKRCESLPRDEEHLLPAPNPKRLTIKSQRKQHEKLKTPFRSPLLSRSTESRAMKEAKPSPRRNNAVENFGSACKFRQNVKDGKEMGEIKAVKESKQNYRTEKAATQFKSPLPLDTVPKLENMVRMTPDMQMLERKLQALKRAVKIKQQNQEHVLEELVQKWTYAGREVAWELWSFVKDNDTSGKESSYSWNDSKWHELEGRKENPSLDSSDPDFVCAETRHEDDDSQQQGAKAEEPVQNSLGTLLRQLGIDPETLGWKEEEGAFVDD